MEAPVDIFTMNSIRRIEEALVVLIVLVVLYIMPGE
jgi:hypothetical protein